MSNLSLEIIQAYVIYILVGVIVILTGCVLIACKKYKTAIIYVLVSAFVALKCLGFFASISFYSIILAVTLLCNSVGTIFKKS